VSDDGVQLVVVRHADTDWTASGQHTGHTDLPLNAAGRLAAASLPGRLSQWSFDEVWCSPLRRARETSEIAGFADRAQPHDDLEEWDYGTYEGVTTTQVHELDPDWDLWRDGCPGGEDAAAVGARADHALASLPADGTVLAFSHGHFLRVLIARWLDLEPAQGALFTIAPGGIALLDHERARRVLSRLD
jgi:broad specificity phosphatase PhoE